MITRAGSGVATTDFILPHALLFCRISWLQISGVDPMGFVDHPATETVFSTSSENGCYADTCPCAFFSIFVYLNAVVELWACRPLLLILLAVWLFRPCPWCESFYQDIRRKSEQLLVCRNTNVVETILACRRFFLILPPKAHALSFISRVKNGRNIQGTYFFRRSGQTSIEHPERYDVYTSTREL